MYSSVHGAERSGVPCSGVSCSGIACSVTQSRRSRERGERGAKFDQISHCQANESAMTIQFAQDHHSTSFRSDIRSGLRQ